jgi:excisionase family DNA binding protein
MTPQASESETVSGARPRAVASSDERELHELLTVDDVAALLKVSRSWVYEHTRMRGTMRSERLPFIKIGKYTRFDARSVHEFLRRRTKVA